MKTRFFLFTDNPRDQRVKRFREECQKKGLELRLINIYKAVLTDQSIFDEDGTEIRIEKRDIVWALSNLTTGHFIARKLKMQGIKIWPDAGAVDFADKFFTNMFFTAIDIPTPKTVLINSYHLENVVKKVGGFPCIIKKNVSTVGKFVEVVNNEKDVIDFIKDTFDKAKKNVLPSNRLRFLLQEFIKEAAGVDYRVLCINGKIIGAIKREAQEGFKSNVSLGGTATQVEVDAKLEAYSKKIMKEGKLFYAGIDFMKVGDDYLAIEVNTSAQFKGFEGATGIDVAKIIVDELLIRTNNKK
jgi:RimK family alpha-L-glutamate ligase